MSRDTPPIRVLTVDDHALLREGIATLVNSESDMKMAAEASNGKEAIEKFLLHRPDVTLRGLQMPAVDGVKAIIGIRSEFPNARIPAEVAAELADHATEDDLTSREIDVLRLIASGNANKEIARHLAIGEEAAKTHITDLLAKLGANDRTHAVTIALKRGIIQL
jgi:DNA-binding NarL/FixJ family response regulator